MDTERKSDPPPSVRAHDHVFTYERRVALLDRCELYVAICYACDAVEVSSDGARAVFRPDGSIETLEGAR